MSASPTRQPSHARNVSLAGKVALVTGSGRNIGRATVLEMARRGADVVVSARANRDEVESVAEEARRMGVRAMAVVADVGERGRSPADGRCGVGRVGPH